MPTYKPQYKDKNGAIKDLNIDYNSLANKPTIGSGTLTIQKNGSNIATFGANSTSNVTANITVPTSLEDLSGNLSTYRLYEPTIINGVTPTSQGIIDITSADRLAFLPADQIIIEKSTDGGATWVSAEFNDIQKRTIFGGLENGGIYIPLNSSGVKSCSCMLRVTITGMKYNVPTGTAETNKYNYWNSTYVKSGERYFNPNLCTLWLSSNSDRIQTTIQMATGANPNSWTTNVVANQCSGWSGRSTIKLGGYVFGGSTDQTGNYWNYRFIFRTQATDGSFDDSKLSTSYTGAVQVIHGIKLYSSNAWTVPSNMVRNGHIYTWDIDQNATFPASVKAPSFYENGTLLSSKYAASSHNHDSSYLGKTATAADSSKLGGQLPSYYAKQSNVVDLSSEQTINGVKNFTGDYTKIDRLLLGTKGDDPLPKIEVYTQRLAATYNLALPDKNSGSYTIATTDDLSNYQPLDADLTSIAGLSGTSGFLEKTAANTWSLDTNSYALASHTHTSLKSNTDNRSTNTTPNNYNSVFNIAGLKTSNVIGLGASTYGTYSCVMGVRGWSDSSGGNAHEIALTGNGYLMHRHGATTSWNDWKRIAYTSDIPTSLPASDVYAWAKAANKPTYTKSEIGLGNVDNTADANKSVNYANSAGSVAWANVSNKPTIPTTDSVTTASKQTSSASSTSKLFLIGATSQSANASTTYSNSKCYVGTDNCLYSNNTKVLTSHDYRPIQMNGSSILTSGSSTALNLKAGTNISLSNSNGTVTISSTASGGGMTSSLIFAGAGDTSGYYTQTLSGGDYKMLLFEVNVNDVDFYLSVPTDYIKTGSKTLYLAAGNSNNGSMGIVEITASNTNFSASVSNGNIIIWNVNVYAYK